MRISASGFSSAASLDAASIASSPTSGATGKALGSGLGNASGNGGRLLGSSSGNGIFNGAGFEEIGAVGAISGNASSDLETSFGAAFGFGGSCDDALSEGELTRSTLVASGAGGTDFGKTGRGVSTLSGFGAAGLCATGFCTTGFFEAVFFATGGGDATGFFGDGGVAT